MKYLSIGILAGFLPFLVHGSPAPQQALSVLPAWFEPDGAGYVSRGSAGSLRVTDAGAVFASGAAVAAMRLSGGSAASLEGAELLPSRSASILGPDPSAWKNGIPHFRRVRASAVYPGIDLEYYVNGRELEFDFLVAPGADPDRIALGFEGASRLSIAADGALALETPGGTLALKAPVAYQLRNGIRRGVDARYTLDGGHVRFALGSYDPSLPLVIDPIFHIGFVGGDQTEETYAAAVDPAGGLWLAGASSSQVDRPLQFAAIQDEPAGRRDAYLAKFVPEPDGSLRFAYWTHFGGSSDDIATSMTIDAAGFIYLGGITRSRDLPRFGGATPDFGGEWDAFVAKLRPEDLDGEVVWFVGVYGGPGSESGARVAHGPGERIYLAGTTDSGELPGVGDGSLQCCNRGGREIFVAKFDPNAGDALEYATFFGGSRADDVAGIAVDDEELVYLAGQTASEDFPVTYEGDFDRSNGALDLFVSQLDVRKPGLDALLVSFYAGGTGADFAKAMVRDPESGRIWVAGHSLSQELPATPTAHRTRSAGAADVILMGFDFNRPPEDALIYSTFLGGARTDVCYGMAAAPGGRLLLTGYTTSTDFPFVDNQTDPAPGGNIDGFLTLIDPERGGADGLVLSRLFGGALTDVPLAAAADAAGNLYSAGVTTSRDLPVTDGSSKRTLPGANQSFVLRAAAPEPAP
ncbi:MAG: hypothetical protein IPM24_25910 [Bryobacterales bacterium]|nr:hypothetical protein [Bryobacterales bacterium]